MRPVIGITANYNLEEKTFTLREYYVNSVIRAGGLPLILAAQTAFIKEYLKLCDGIVFTGGGDLDPRYFGQDPSAQLGEINPLRDEFEIELARQVLVSGQAALGICRGCQIMNIAVGGSLIQHLSTDLCHEQKAPRDYPIHDIFIASDSRLSSILGSDKISVNSFHHQAVDQPGDGIYCSAYAQDGTVEAIEYKGDAFYLGVQWHPECMSDQSALKLFSALVEKSIQS